MFIRRLLPFALLLVSLGGCQSGRQALEITRPTPGDNIAVLFEFDEHSHTTWIGDAYLQQSMKVEESLDWDLDHKVADPLIARLREDANAYVVSRVSGARLATRRQQQGHTHQGFAELPRVFTRPGLSAFSKGSLEAQLQDALGAEYDRLLAEGADYLLVVRQLPVVANAQSRDGADRRIMNSYGYFLKCDGSYRGCDAPKALLRGQVELIDLRSGRYVGLYPFLVNFSIPADTGTDGVASPAAMGLIDAQLRALNAEIDRFLRSTRLISNRKNLARSDS